MEDKIVGAGPPLLEVTRDQQIESLHRGVVVVCDPKGRVIKGVGNREFVTFLRSAAKPLQLIPLLERGLHERFHFTGQELAIMAASHNGERFHIQTVSGILEKIGLGEEALRCGTHYPYDEATALHLRTAGEEPSPLHNNCSGKHAGMLALAVDGDYTLHDYYQPGHPVQKIMLKTVAEFTGLAPRDIVTAKDGCGVPTFALPIWRAAWAFARLADSRGLPSIRREACRQLVEAVRSHPEMVGGSKGRLDTDLMRIKGERLFAKSGAEGYLAVGILPHQGSGLGIAIKVEDGSSRATGPVAVETLRQLGVLEDQQLEALAPYHRPPIKNRHGQVVGEIRPCFQLERVE